MTGWLSDEDREEARRIAAEMPPWTDEQLAELARVVDAAPRRNRDAS